jgi:hypothetical protein
VSVLCWRGCCRKGEGGEGEACEKGGAGEGVEWGEEGLQSPLGIRFACAGEGVEWGEEGPKEGRCDLQPCDPMLTAEGPKPGRVMPAKNHGGYSVRMVTLEGKTS